MQCSPVKYAPDAPPQAIVMVMLREPIQTSPHLKAQMIAPSGETHSIDMRMPVFLNKFTEPIEMPLEVFTKFWDDITHNRPSSFQKVDCIMKNPAPLSVPYIEVLKKIAFFFANSMNLKVFPAEEWRVRAV